MSVEVCVSVMLAVRAGICTLSCVQSSTVYLMLWGLCAAFQQQSACALYACSASIGYGLTRLTKGTVRYCLTCALGLNAIVLSILTVYAAPDKQTQDHTLLSRDRAMGDSLQSEQPSNT